MDVEKVYLEMINEMRDYFGKNGFSRAVVGLSGGIDSSLTLKLAVDALKAENVMGVHMPDLGVTDRVNSEHAQGLAEFLGVKFEKVVINRFVSEFDNLPWDRNELASMNVKARVRANILYDYANSAKALVLGTSNKSEIMLGYGTKHGDIACDLVVLGSLYKTEVYQLAKFLDLPPQLIEKAPSAELYKGQTDASELGAGYDILDQILMATEKGYPLDSFDQNLVKKVQELMKRNAHKGRPPLLIGATDHSA